MDYLGLTALGIFVGTVVTKGLGYIDGLGTAAKAATLILGAALSGTVIVFLDRFAKKTPALGAYALGLLLGLMWTMAGVAVENITSGTHDRQLLGWLHLVAAVAASVVVALLVLPPAFRQVWRDS